MYVWETTDLFPLTSYYGGGYGYGGMRPRRYARDYYGGCECPVVKMIYCCLLDHFLITWISTHIKFYVHFHFIVVADGGYGGYGGYGGCK